MIRPTKQYGPDGRDTLEVSNLARQHAHILEPDLPPVSLDEDPDDVDREPIHPLLVALIYIGGSLGSWLVIGFICWLLFG